jgi:hypothetical protein
MCMVGLHTGLVPPHWAPSTQATQVPVITSHTGAATEQATPFDIEHCPQAPLG